MTDVHRQGLVLDTSETVLGPIAVLRLDADFYGRRSALVSSIRRSFGVALSSRRLRDITGAGAPRWYRELHAIDSPLQVTIRIAKCGGRFGRELLGGRQEARQRSSSPRRHLKKARPGTARAVGGLCPPASLFNVTRMNRDTDTCEAVPHQRKRC
jgi:hypothetical protein